MMRLFLCLGLVMGCLSFCSMVGFAGERATASFESDAPSQWKSSIGKWEVRDGVMHGAEQESDHHPAAARWLVPFKDGKVTGKFRNVDARAVNIGFDPAPSELDKKGHLCALTVLANKVTLAIAPNKADPKSKAQSIAQADIQTPKNEWVDFTITSEGDTMTVQIGNATLKATHPEIAAKKTGVVVRVMGGSAQFDELTIESK
ncbi:hypothetical protein [Neorhodopirellula pilleata]|uniref:3-keto-disaccharide hydrolase domain-containing protein n=1 Tax=Neorhodopirellula pilleata TaxID=2714738 RepID=A0A5C6AV33_9BACT|nr:hypothetical protein [Neorhodopirellula pilleata]TWU03301.1 hypothetical protein Pla100_02190 [Neorhodopirellula pilleata]